MINRTLIAPMIGRHSSRFRAHEALPLSDLFPMDRIIDFGPVEAKVNVVPLNTSVTLFTSSLSKENMLTIFHPFK